MRKKQSVLLLVVLLAVCGAYSNSFQNSFHFDDFHTVTDNPAVRSLSNISRFFTDATTFSVLPANRTYRPIVSTTLALDYALGHGYTLFWFHFSTSLFFLLQIIVLYALYRVLLDRIDPSSANAWLALFGASWFGLHPAIAETINYVIQRGDLYCTLGCTAALCLFARYPALRRTGLYLLPFAFALLSKPPAAVFPILLIAYVYFFEGEEQSNAIRLRHAVIAALPSLLLTGVLMGLQAAMTPKSFTPSILSPWDYRLTQPYVWLRYFAALFLPLHLNVDTDLTVFTTLNLQALAGLIFLAALCAAIWFTARRRRLYPIAFGLLWFVVTQLPTSLYPLSEAENDHRMFFSFAGLILAVVWAGALLYERLVTAVRRTQMRPLLITAAVFTLTGYAYGVHQRNAVWHDEESLWHDDVLKCPQNGRGLMIYGLTQMSKGNYPVALDYFERALVYTPNYPTLEINLGVVNGAMADLGDVTRTAEAERHFLRAIALAPNDDTTHAYYARWLIAHNRAAEAIAQCQTAITLNPQRPMQRDLLIDAFNHAGDSEAAHQAAISALAVVPNDPAALQEIAHPATQNADYWINLSLAQYQQVKFQASIVSARHALAINPNLAAAYNNIGAGYAGLQQWDEAIRNEREALRIDPSLQIAQNNLRLYQAHGASAPQAKTALDYLNDSLVLNQAGKYEECIAVARHALQLDPKMAEAWNNIAASDEALHRWDDAIAAAQKAIALKPDFQLAKNNLAWSLSQKKAQASSGHTDSK
ncbi:MAG: tetratricopeptide repeat protein [Acidobacteriaceae bacterium]|nr:tetratricopeptide repeat protein [Acidobacteriaceae bacterium]